ncbi:MAG: sigma 54-interacting transcriptional regulator [Pyrinomonadaceae bacterium]
MADNYVDDSAFKGRSILDEKILLFARVPHYVLITGERGTGKTTIAHQMHDLSPRSKRDFVSVNCASFTSELLESELFGYERGAFTGATAAKAGLFEAAQGGTLFLDEIGELSLGLQAKFLKAVEERRIRRVGGTMEREIDVRVVAATSRDLRSMVKNGTFRADLFDRLNILQLETLPLRYQKERIVETFLDQLETDSGTIGIEEPLQIEKEVLVAIQELEWKGNYREIRNFATRLAVETIDEPAITLQVVNNMLSGETRFRSELELADEKENNYLTVTLDPATDDLDSVYIKSAAIFVEDALQRSNGNLRRAARSINTTHSTISRILKKNQERFVTPSNASGSLAAAA